MSESASGLILVGEFRGTETTKNGKYMHNIEHNSGNQRVLSNTNGHKKGDKYQAKVGVFDRCQHCGGPINGLIIERK
jgi:hypothetical protein